MLLLWCCGVHGQMVTMALTAPITTAAFTANAALVAKGQAPIFHPIFMTLGIGFRRNRKYSWTMYFILLESKITTIKSFWESDNCA